MRSRSGNKNSGHQVRLTGQGCRGWALRPRNGGWDLAGAFSGTCGEAGGSGSSGGGQRGHAAVWGAASQCSGAKPAAPAQRFDIDDFAVQGADTLPQIEIEEAVYPYLGPNKSADDVEKARAALEKAYHDKGFQTVSVAVPQQNVQGGVSLPSR